MFEFEGLDWVDWGYCGLCEQVIHRELASGCGPDGSHPVMGVLAGRKP